MPKLTKTQTPPWDEAVFEIGGDDQLRKLRQEFTGCNNDAESQSRFADRWASFLRDCHVKIGTLLKCDSLSILLGAGASKAAGGVLLGGVPRSVERDILDSGITERKVAKWLELFYLAVSQLSEDDSEVPSAHDAIVARQRALRSSPPLQVNYECLLSLIHRWRSACSVGTDKIRIEGHTIIEATGDDLDQCLSHAKRALARQCLLPKKGDRALLDAHRMFVRKLLTRPLNLKRVSLFTLNYDTLIEQAADAEGIVLLDGFVGTIRRVFRPESYDQDLYFPAETTEGRVHRLDRVLHLYKLHGSINWASEPSAWDNPYGVILREGIADDSTSTLIYPTPAKYGDTLGMPYSELFRRFAAAITRPQSSLFVIGYGFGDDHVNALIHQALSVPSFTLVIVDPYAPTADASSTKFVARLRARHDRRVWVLSGLSFGTFSKFAADVLPDLRDEEILTEVMRTYRSLQSERGESLGGAEPHGE